MKRTGHTLNYIDLGTHKGQEIDMLLDQIVDMPALESIRIYGVDANPEMIEHISGRFTDRANIVFGFFNFAIASDSGETPLYRHSANDVGDSIYPTKKGVTEDHVMVPKQRFSRWLLENVDLREPSVNVLKVNIEGAEWDLVNDLEQAELFPAFDIYLASMGGEKAYNDISKCSELSAMGCVEECKDILARNDVVVEKFCYENVDHPNIDMRQAISDIIDRKSGVVSG